MSAPTATTALTPEAIADQTSAFAYQGMHCILEFYVTSNSKKATGFGLLPPRVQPRSARGKFGSKLVALVADWASFADLADL
jgi:hypothetical protein